MPAILERFSNPLAHVQMNDHTALIDDPSAKTKDEKGTDADQKFGVEEGGVL